MSCLSKSFYRAVALLKVCLPVTVCVASIFMCILTAFAALPIYSRLQPAAWKMDCNIRKIVFYWCAGSLEISHLIKAMIEQDDLGLPALGTLSDQHIARVWVTVNKAVHKDHFTVQLTQVLWDLFGRWQRVKSKKLSQKYKHFHLEDNRTKTFLINYPPTHV